MHDVFHVSLLKQYVANPEHVLDIDETILVNQGEFPLKSEGILESQEKEIRHRIMRRILVKRNGYHVEDASWKDWELLVNQFPYLKDWKI